MGKRERLPNFKLAGAIEFKEQKLDTDVVFAEDKLDGLRMVVIVRDGKALAYTRNGIEIPNAKLITDAIEKRFKHSGVFDGEGIALPDWNNTQSVMMTQIYDKKLASQLRYRTFDFLRIKEWDKKECRHTLQQRKEKLKELINAIKSQRISYLPHNILKYKKDEINKFMRVRAAAGLEGGVFKDPNSYYSFRKNKDWLKLKPYQECDAVVTGMKPGKKGKTGQMLGLIGSLDVKCKIDHKKITFNTSGMDMDVRRQLTNLYEANRLKGIVVEVRHEGVTVNGKVRFPRVTRVRFDKDKP